MESVEIKKLEGAIEAILFTMGDSVELGKIAAAVEHDEDTVRKIIHQMMDKYEEEDRGVRIVELENSFQMCTKPECYEPLIRIAARPKKPVLTDVAMETLAIIAYREENGPFTSTEDIMSVPGIKEGTYEKIKDKIAIK